jgi:hypothetical protein
LETIFWVKLLKLFDADPGWKKFGFGIRDGKKSDPGFGIRNKHPGSATLIVINGFKLVISFLSFSLPESVPGLGHLAAQLADEGGQVARQVLRLNMPEYVRLHLKGRDGREQNKSNNICS